MSQGASHRRGVWQLVTAAQMQALDRETIEGRGVAGEILMESAGRAVVVAAMRLRAASTRGDGGVIALCGAGNNGGDGFVAVRHLRAEGIPAEAILLGDPARLPKDAAANWERLEPFEGARRVIRPEAGAVSEVDWRALFAGTSVAIDALFGTGLTRELEGGIARVIDAVNDARQEGLRVLAVDLPSGICADTGAVLGCAVEADATTTISLPKIGLALEPGRAHAGAIEVARIGISDPGEANLPTEPPRAELWNALAASERLPVRDPSGHKGSFGHVLVVGGSTGKMGAGALAARGGLRAGAGLVTLAHPIGREAELAGLPVEVMSAPIAANAEGSLTGAGEKALLELAAGRDVVALGPGIGQDADTVRLVRSVATSIDRPLVLDADGLNAFVEAVADLRDRTRPTVLTPHPGEAGRLLGQSAQEVNRDRLGAARRLARDTGAVVVLKGAGTVVADAAGRVLVNPTGGPSLATGGTGDVLTGIVAALLAAGLPAFEAAGLAVWWHGAAADGLPASRMGFGSIASEVADALPATALQIVRSGGEPGGFLDLRFPGP